MTPYRFRGNDDKLHSIDIPDSSGGINSRAQASEIENSFCTVLYNADISDPGKIKKRLGCNQVLNDLGTTPILFLVYLKAPSVDARMVHIFGKRMYKSTLPLETAGSWVDIDSTDHFTDNQTTTVGILAGNELFFSNGTDNVFSYNGTSITDEGATTSDPPKGKCLAYFKNRLWVANTTSNPDWVYFSNAGDAHTFNHSTQIFKVSTGDSTAVTNMVPYLESSLIIFKESSIHEIMVAGTAYSYWNLRPINSRYGCVAPECAKYHGGKIYFLAEDGVRVLPEPEHRMPLSFPIKTEIDDINWDYRSRARAIVFDNKYFLAVPTGSSTYPNKVYVMDLRTYGWTVYTGWNVGCWGIWIEDGAEVLMYGDSNDGIVRHCFKSTQFNDDSTAVNFQLETKAFNFQLPFNYKVGGELEVDIASSTGNTVTVSAAVDGGSYSQLGTCTSTTRFPLESMTNYKEIKFKLQNNATSTEQLIFNGYRVNTFPEEYY